MTYCIHVILSSSSPPSRVYRACLQRTSLFSLLTGALLEAIAALGARSALPCPFPQGSNSHVLLKGGSTHSHVEGHPRGEMSEAGASCLILRRRASHCSPVVHQSFPHVFSFTHSGVWVFYFSLQVPGSHFSSPHSESHPPTISSKTTIRPKRKSLCT